MYAIKSDERDPENILRDSFRNPYETLSFFELNPSMVVVELSPGRGWYTEILANFLSTPGQLIAAHFDKNTTNNYLKKNLIQVQSIKTSSLWGFILNYPIQNQSMQFSLSEIFIIGLDQVWI